MKSIVEKLRSLYEKHREIIAYLFIGGVTTVISFSLYFLFARVFLWTPAASSAASDGVAIAVAYVANKRYVFRSVRSSREALAAEAAGFFITRIAFLALSSYLMYLTVDLWAWPDVPSRAGVTLLVIALNYIASKFFIFKKNEKS